MGVCFLQHRRVTGLYSNKAYFVNKGPQVKQGVPSDAWKQGLRDVSFRIILVLYAFLIISLLIVAQEIPKLIKNNDAVPTNIKYTGQSTVETNVSIRHLTSCWCLILISYLYKLSNIKFVSLIKNYGIPKEKYFGNMGSSAKMRIIPTFWITSINLILIILTLPAIKNPGPVRQENLSCLYQNIRGFVPFSGLTKKDLLLIGTNFSDFQAFSSIGCV